MRSSWSTSSRRSDRGRPGPRARARGIGRGVLPALAAALLVTAFRPAGADARPDPAWDALRQRGLTDRAALDAALDTLGAQYERICVQLGEANWALYAGQPGPDREAAKDALQSLLTDPVNLKLVQTWLPQAASSGDSAFARRLALWKNAQTGARVEFDSRVSTIVERLAPKVIRFQPKVGGRTIDRQGIADALQNDADRGRRRRAFEAYIPLSKTIEKDVVQLARLRNARAKDLGYKDYPHMVLELNGVSYDWLVKTMKRIEDATNSMYFEWLNGASRTFSVFEPEAWDLRYLVAQTTSLPPKYFPRDKANERLFATLRGMGFDPDSLPIRMQVGDIPYGGFNVAVHIPTDDRLLVNPADGSRFYESLFHEYGHGLEATNTRVTSPILKGYEWALGASTPALSEGIGQAMAEWIHDADWLRGVAGMPSDEIKRDLPLIRRAEAYRLRQILVDVLTELALYDNPSGDVAGFERTTRQRLLGVGTPPSSQSWWAANPFLLDYPVYEYTYLLADMIGGQIHDAMNEKFGAKSYTQPQVAAWLVENFFGPGESLDWNTKLARATGKPLDVEGYATAFEKP